MALLAALALAVLALGVVLVVDPGSSSRGSGEGSPDVRLDASSVPPGARRDEPAPTGGGHPSVVQALPPGESPRGAPGTSESDPPERVQRENARLRRALEDLRAIERQRARVSRTLRRAGAIYGPVVGGSGDLIWAVAGSVVSPFGQRWGRLHAGIDIAARAGTVIYAAQSGRVVLRGPTGGYGNYVCVQHTRRLTTCYAHLSRFMTRRGKAVRQGEPIGLVGCTGHCFGDHLHFETWVSGRPVDPMRFL